MSPRCPRCGSSMIRRKDASGLFWGCSRFPRCKGTREIGYRKPGNLRRILRKGHMTHNKKQTTPAAIKPVQELAALMEITPNKLRLAIGLAAAAGYTVDLGLGIRVKVAILDEAHLSDEAVMELGHIESLDFREPQEMLLAATAVASEQHQSLLAAPPASKRIQ